MTTQERSAGSPAFKCPQCGRRFGEANALYQHTKAKHGRKAAKARPAAREEYEESYGEMFRRAEWDNDPDLDFIREMMP